MTGGSGLIGGSVVRTLLHQGQQVRVLARQKSKTEHLVARGVQIVYGDILDKNSIKRALEGCTMLYHAAALWDFWGIDKKDLMNTIREGTRNALDAALLVGLEKVIYTSTALTIGEIMGDVGTETTTHRGYFLSKYERAKFEAEQIALSYLNKGLPLVIVNPASVYGPGDLKPLGRAIIDFINGRIPGLFKGSNSLVYLEDVGMGHVLAAAKGKVGERYILSGNIVTLNEWGGLLCELSGVKMPPILPEFLSGMYSSFCEMIAHFTNRPPVLSRETFRTISHGFKVDGSKAKKELGVEYTSLEEGLRQAILWYWSQGRLELKPSCVKRISK